MRTQRLFHCFGMMALVNLCLLFGVPESVRSAPGLLNPTEEATSNQGDSSSARRTVEVAALWFATSPSGGALGGTSRVRVTVEPNPTKEFRIGFFESEVGGSGSMWQASGWMAAIMAALTTGFNPATTQISFDVAGRIDGPSAGALMTVGVLAALRGDKVREDAAMTGTINPDGTIGPVGGIPHKIEGAARSGKKLILVPSGQRFDMDIAQKRMVDVVDHGRRLGVEVREVADIYAAYQVLTDKPLPKSAAGERPEVTGQIFNRMQAKAKEWFARYQEARSQYEALPAGIKSDILQSLIAEAEVDARRSDQLTQQGLVGGAYVRAVKATTSATVVVQIGRTLEIFASQGLDGAINYLRASSAVATKVSAMADRLKAEQPRTLGDVNALTSAYSNLVTAVGLTQMAESLLQQKPQSQEEALSQIITASVFYRMADLGVEFGKDQWDVGSGLGGAPLPAEVNLEVVADFFRRAAEANLNLFESVVINEQVAKPAGVNLDHAKQQFMGADIMYAMSRANVDVLPALDQYFGGGAPIAYAKLGSAVSAYSGSASLIAKYYSLKAQLDETGQVVGIGQERALLNMLDLADEHARRSIATLRQHGVDPALFVVSYEAARLSREGTPMEKLEALTEFWAAYIQARVTAYLGGFAGK